MRQIAAKKNGYRAKSYHCFVTRPLGRKLADAFVHCSLAYGIRATADPFTFLAWFFMIDGVVMPVLAARRWRRAALKPPLRPLLLRGWVGGLIAFVSFGAIMLATRLDKVGEAAVLRETSTVFAALIGWLVLKETVGPRRIALMALIAAGAVIVEMGG